MGQAVASWLGYAPNWPNHRIWAIVAGLASACVAIYAVIHERRWLRASTAAVMLAGFGRAVGWIVSSESSSGQLLAAVSVWAIVAALFVLVYIKAGMVHRS